MTRKNPSSTQPSRINQILSDSYLSFRRTSRAPLAGSTNSFITLSIALSITLSITLSMGCSDDEEPTLEEQNTELVQSFLTDVVAARNADLADQYLSPGYIQHNFAVEDGIEAFKDALRGAQFDSFTPLRLIAEGDLVIAHSRLVLPDGAGEMAVADIYRIDDGSIVEHWDSVQPVPAEQVPADNSMFDGPEVDLKAFDEAGVAKNKETAVVAFDLFFNQRDFAAAEALHDSDFIQHNPGTDNGWDAFETRLQGFFLGAPDMHWIPKRVIGAGDFVMIHGQYTFSALDCGDDDAEGSFNAVDLFRFDPDTGLIAEHWDIISNVPDQIVGRSPFDGAGLYTGPQTACRALSDSEKDADLVLTFNDKLFDDGDLDAIDEYLAEGYINHNPGSPNTREAFKGVMTQFIAAGGAANMDTRRFISDGGYVYLHNEFEQQDGTINAVGDIYRVENGRITEHWDVIQPEPAPADSVPTDNTMLGGPQVDLAAFDAAGVEANKAKVVQAFDLFFNQRDFAAAEALHDPDLIQHNPGTDHGWDAFETRLQGFFAQSPDMHWTVKRVLGAGDMVVVHGQYTFTAETCGDDGAVGAFAAFDIFRIDPESGLIAEHWDMLQTVADPADQVPAGQSMFDGPGLYDGPQTACP